MDQTFVERLQAYRDNLLLSKQEIERANVDVIVEQEVASFRVQRRSELLTEKNEKLTKIVADVDCIQRMIDNEKKLNSNE